MHPNRDSGPPAWEAEAERLEDIERRLIRIETRLTRLLHHFGLRSDGTPRNLPRDEQ